MKNIIIGNEYFVAKKGYGPQVEKVRVIRQTANTELTGFFDVKSIDLCGTFGAHQDRIFETRDEAIALIKQEDDRCKNEYRVQIKTMDDLLRFMLNNNISYCDEYGDHLAREVVIEKIKEFGFEVDSD